MQEQVRYRTSFVQEQVTLVNQGQKVLVFLLPGLLCQIDRCEESPARFDQETAEYYRPFEEVVDLLDSIPGITRQTADILTGEMGIGKNRFLPVFKSAPEFLSPLRMRRTLLP